MFRGNSGGIGALRLAGRGRAVDPLEVMRPVLVIVGLLGIASIAFVVWVVLTSGRYSDFTVFYDSARALREGRDLYFSPVSGPGFRTMIPPHLIALMAPLAWLPIREAIIVWWVITACAMVGCARLWSRALPRNWAVYLSVLLFASAPGYLNIRFANHSWLTALAVTWAWVAWRERRSPAAPIVLGIAASTKLFLLILLPYWIFRKNWSASVRFVGGAALAVAVGAAVCGPTAYASWLEALSQQTWQGLTLNISVLGWFTRVLDLPLDNVTPMWVQPNAIVPLWLLTSIVLAALLWWRLRGREDVDRDFAAVLTAMLLVTPAGWVYYLPLAAGPLTASAAPRPSRLWLFGAACMLIPYPLLDLGQPSALLTMTLASSYMWGGLLLFAATLLAPTAVSLDRSQAEQQAQKGKG